MQFQNRSDLQNQPYLSDKPRALESLVSLQSLQLAFQEASEMPSELHLVKIHRSNAQVCDLVNRSAFQLESHFELVAPELFLPYDLHIPLASRHSLELSPKLRGHPHQDFRGYEGLN